MSDRINRNPHPDFGKVQASRAPAPAPQSRPGFTFTQTAAPAWAFGSGANRSSSASAATSTSASASASAASATTGAGADKAHHHHHHHHHHKHKHIAIDPYEENRPAVLNYKFLISAIVPRPIAFLSTYSSSSSAAEGGEGGGGSSSQQRQEDAAAAAADGKESSGAAAAAAGAGDSVKLNLAPFSYFNMVNHDPPLFVVGFAGSLAQPKDSLRNLLETKEATINIISDEFVEAANATAIDAPPGVSEWEIAGLTPVADTHTVRAPRVREAVVSIEARLDMVKEWESRAQPGKKTGVMVVLEGTRFWVREDAVNEERSLVDPAVLQAIGRLGGITYSRTIEGFELLRPKFGDDLGGEEGLARLKKQ